MAGTRSPSPTTDVDKGPVDKGPADKRLADARQGLLTACTNLFGEYPWPFTRTPTPTPST
ncbi:hypothetical protein ACLQ29_31155 [Micromonospora sp. DT228]|uniref:hypothetical protein n=1 Tax=Micromonospora sp. DT228 TaxID=3393443 RepID=UPI003CF688E4